MTYAQLPRYLVPATASGCIVCRHRDAFILGCPELATGATRSGVFKKCDSAVEDSFSSTQAVQMRCQTPLIKSLRVTRGYKNCSLVLETIGLPVLEGRAM